MINIFLQRAFLFNYSLIVLLVISCSRNTINDISINTKSCDSIKIVEDKIKKISPLLLPDTSSTSDGNYSGIGSFCFVPPDRIFYLDTYFYKIKAISAETGKDLFSFGKRGSGPGEFEPQPALKYIEHQGVLAIDNNQLRASLFGDDGKLKETIKLKFPLSDFIFLDDSTALTGSFMLLPGYKPIKIISLKSTDVTSEFGFIIEPQAKMLEKVNASSFTRGKIGFFTYMSMVNLLLLPNRKEFIYSQSQPYELFKYNIENHSYIRFDAKLPFPVENKMLLEFDEKNKVAKSGWMPSAKVMTPQLINNKIVVPIFSVNAITNYIDIYSLNGIFEKRVGVPALPGLNAFKVIFNSTGTVFYLIVGNQNRLFWIERFKVEKDIYN